MSTSKALVLAAAALALSCAACGAAAGQDLPKGAPPSWNVLVRCAKMADDDASLACFREAMKASGYAPKPEEVRAERHRRFGLSMPQIGLLRRHAKEEGAQASAEATPTEERVAPAPPSPAASSSARAAATPPAVAAAEPPATAEENENQITTQLDEVATIPPDGRLLMITTDGGIWVQTYSNPVSPLPKKGQTMVIKRNRLGGYMCILSKHTGVRCARKR